MEKRHLDMFEQDGERKGINIKLWDYDDKGNPIFITLQYCHNCDRQRQHLSCGYLKYYCTECGAIHKTERYSKVFNPTGQFVDDKLTHKHLIRQLSNTRDDDGWKC